MFKRDYQVSFISQDPATIDGSMWWGATGHRFVDGGYKGPSGMDAIFCAVNHFGQDDVYKLPSEYNAFCRRDDGPKLQGWNVGFSMGRCKVTFNNPGSTKKSIGTFAGWEVESVRMLDGDDDDDDEAET